MLQTIAPKEMKRVEQRAMVETGVTGAVLMERAAGHIARAVERQLQKRPGRVLCICGTGNNGGDGMAALRLLCAQNKQLSATLWLMEGEWSPEAQQQKERLEAETPQVQICQWTQKTESQVLPPFPGDTSCLVDALFGTGLCREVTGLAALLCQKMQAAESQGIPVIAVDIPSGLHGETGMPLGVAVHASETITFHRPKTGLFLGEGPDHAGSIAVASIGIPEEWDDAAGFWVLEEGDIPRLFPPRPKVCHKGSFGRVLVVAGSLPMAGAAAICALAALRTGAGLVTVACPEEIVTVVQTLCPCATCVALPRDPEEACKLLAKAADKADALAIGPGLGTDAYAQKVVGSLVAFLRHSRTPAVLDADGLTLLGAMEENQEKLASCHVLTPHPAEAGRLLGISTAQVLADAPSAARQLQERYGASIVLKGTASLLVSGQKEGINILGTPGLAKGGSGDALTGVLAALLANQSKGAFGEDLFALLQAGTALHGLAGRQAAALHGERGMLATDLCQELGKM